MNPILPALISAAIVSLLSFTGVFALAFSEKQIQKFLIIFVSFAAGALIGGAFFHLIPEVLTADPDFFFPSIYILVGFSLFFVLEKVLRWHHCHNFDCDSNQHLGHLNLVGDGIHNFIDGLVIISAFAAGPQLGIPVVISISLHEIPQEISDFGVLLHSGWKRGRALFFNFLSALVAIFGVVIGYLLLNQIEGINQFLLPFAAGGFIYIAASDLIPELHKEVELRKSIISFLVFLSGLVFMLVTKFIGV